MNAPRTALVTGVHGQDGVYLARLLADEGTRVIGTVRPGSLDNPRRTAYLADVTVVELDIRDSVGLAALLAHYRPDELYNLAAFTSVGRSWQAPDTVVETNAEAVVGLLKAVRAHRDMTGQNTRVFHASSAEVGADNPYAAAKSAAEDAVISSRIDHGLHACFANLHNHESPLRGRQFVTRKITEAVARIALGRPEALVLGNLDVRRDWGFAGDYVDAMRRMARLDEPIDLELGTGTAHTLGDLVDAAFQAAGIDDAWSYVTTDQRLMRPTDVPLLVADPGPARTVIDWVATITFGDLIAAMVNVDMKRLRTGVEEDLAYLTVHDSGLKPAPTASDPL